MKLWITTIGFEKCGCANNIWLASRLEDFTPDKVIFLYNKHKKVLANKESNKAELMALFENIEIEEIEFEESIEVYKKTFEKVLFDHKSDDIAIDVTPGMKYMSILGVDLAIKNKIKRVYYAHYKAFGNYENKPIRQIPVVHVDLVNFMKK
ncbi:MAG: TM1812 family CRISPR-associated protein [Actinomycetota bacterium]